MNALTHSKSLPSFALAVLGCSFIHTAALAGQRLVPSQYATIQAAMDAAVDGDEVILADGTYTGVGNKNLYFNGKLITVRSASGNPAACIIDCQNSGQAFTIDDNETNATILRGLTISNASQSSISILGASPAIIDCDFLSNGISSSGGAISISSSTSTEPVVIRDCSFIDNQVNGGGGAIFINVGSLNISRCLFLDNHAIGTSSPRGGAILAIAGNIVISNSEFYGNGSGDLGGAIYAYPDSRLQISNSVFSGNSAFEGGAIRANSCRLNMVNSTLFGNSAVGSGGGVAAAGATAMIRITNCILWGNSPSQITAAGTTDVSYSNIQGGFAGTGNLNIDPNFADANGDDNIIGTEDDDLRLSPGSPVIDDGHNVPFHFKSDAASWLALRSTAVTYAIDQFKPGIANGSGCTTNGDWAPTLLLAGGEVEFHATNSTGVFQCPLYDGSTTPAVSDGSLISPSVKLHLFFDPPITAFHTFYGSLAIGDTATMKLFAGSTLPYSGGTQVGQFTSGVSAHDTNAIGHGFSSLVPIDRVEITTTDTATVVGAFNNLATGDTSLGTVNVPQYAALPQGASTQKDFGVVFGSADLPGDLDGKLRVRNGDGNASVNVDMGAYEFNPCPSDIDGDNAVSINDLLAVINAWGATGPHPADISPPGGDGNVNINDLLAVINGWGSCP